MNTLQALVVASDVGQREFYCMALEACGIDCHEAQDGIDALKFSSDYGIDIVLTALSMPRLDGFELLDLTRRGVFGANPPPVIMCAGSLEENELVRGRDLRACSGVLSPATTREKVIDVVCAVLGRE